MLSFQVKRCTRSNYDWIDSAFLGCASCIRSSSSKSAWALPPLARGSQRCPSSSSTRWRTRQAKDRYVINAKVQDLKSRAAFKLLEVCGSYSHRSSDSWYADQRSVQDFPARSNCRRSRKVVSLLLLLRAC